MKMRNIGYVAEIKVYLKFFFISVNVFYFKQQKCVYGFNFSFS